MKLWPGHFSIKKRLITKKVTLRNPARKKNTQNFRFLLNFQLEHKKLFDSGLISLKISRFIEALIRKKNDGNVRLENF